MRIITDGGYRSAESGEWLDISTKVATSRQRSALVPATAPLPKLAKANGSAAAIEIADEGTLSAARRLFDRGLSVAALNFASHRNAGGGWLSGAQAQEESLARCSCLYAALTAPGPCAQHYQKRNDKNPLYDHTIIYSPDVPILRSEDGALLPRTWPLAFISAAAPNAGLARSRGVSDAEILQTYAERAERVLTVAAARGHDAVVLGAWGCGVFKNDPRAVAHIWQRLLSGSFRGAFKVVAFPMLGPASNREPFMDALGAGGVPRAPDPEPTARGWREIMATTTTVDGVETVRVYQAYNEQIAASAARANSFIAPRDAGIWKDSRMTWVKPSAAWMAYRCGWTLHKDPNQASVLALDLDADGFRALLARAVVSHSESQPRGSYKDCPVVVQWDPEREMDPAIVPPPDHKEHGAPFLRSLGEEVRSIQVGLRGESVAALCDPRLVRRITDVTASFRAAHAALATGDLTAARRALWPDASLEERPMAIAPELRRTLQMDRVANEQAGPEPVQAD